MESLTLEISRLALSYGSEEFPEDLQILAGQSLLDWLSVTLAGWESPLARVLRSRVGEGRALLVGSGSGADIYGAALANGAAGHILDFDDAHPRSRIHPGAVLWPSLLAAATGSSINGREFLSSFIAGLEIQSRLSELVGVEHYRCGWHSTATLGIFGATVAAARIFRLDYRALARALSLSATASGGLRSVFGTDGKAFEVARAAADGLRSADLVRLGISASEDVFENQYGYLALYSKGGGNFDFGSEWHSRGLIFKYYPACFGVQAPVEAALELKRKQPVGDNFELLVEVEPQYLSVCNISDPETMSEARFSLRHLVSLAWSGRDPADESNYSGDALRERDLIELRSRIQVKGDASLGRGQARVTFKGNEQTVVVFHDSGRAEMDLSLNDSKISKKSRFILLGILKPEAIIALRELVVSLPGVSDFDKWLGQLRDLMLGGRLLGKNTD